MSRRFLSAFIIFLGCGHLGYAADLTSSAMSSRRGFFSLYGNYGYQQSRLLNPDGSGALYRGYEYGLGLDIRLGEGGPGDFRIFINSIWSSGKGEEDTSSTLKAQQVFGGFRVFANDYFFLAAGYGQNDQSLESGTAKSELKNNMLGVGIGFEFAITEAIFAGIDLWYKTNPIVYRPQLTANSFSESGVIGIRLIYSPAITSITNVIRGGR